MTVHSSIAPAGSRAVLCAGRVYVVGAYVSNGGTFMAYHLGRILHQDFGCEVTVVTVGDETPGHGVFRYDPEFPVVALDDLERVVRPEDVLICNPSFSKHNFGLRLPCRKLMYIQGFSTFSLLDRFFDHYVTVSGFVQQVIRTTYGLETRVISPFICDVPDASAWAGRPVHALAINLKGKTGDQPLLLDRLRGLLRARAPDIEADIDWDGSLLSAQERRPHADIMHAIGRARYLLTLSVGEGFGLVPLEAMAQGVVVLGLDGFGGRDYMRPGINCLTAPYPDLEAVADHMVQVMRDPQYGQALSDAARETAKAYSYDRFRQAWIAEFERAFALPAHLTRPLL